MESSPGTRSTTPPVVITASHSRTYLSVQKVSGGTRKKTPPPTFLRKNVSGLLATGQFRQAFFFTVVAGTSVFQRIKGSERWVSLSWAQALGGRRGGAFWGLEHQIWGYLAWGQGRCRSTASRTHTHTHTQTHTHRDQLRTT